MLCIVTPSRHCTLLSLTQSGELHFIHPVGTSLRSYYSSPLTLRSQILPSTPSSIIRRRGSVFYSTRWERISNTEAALVQAPWYYKQLISHIVARTNYYKMNKVDYLLHVPFHSLKLEEKLEIKRLSTHQPTDITCIHLDGKKERTLCNTWFSKNFTVH